VGVVLRPLSAGDAEWLSAFLTGDEWPFHTGTLDTAGVRERLASGHFDGPTVATFIVEHEGTAVGVARVHDLDDATPLLDLRIAREQRGRGVGRTALRELADRIFATYDVDRLEGTTRQDNVAMRRAFVAAGFVKEAHYRRAWPGRDGEAHDAVGYAILRSDWRSGRTTPVAWVDEPT
jgi:RimJ/RimL family protein N-acetyltransferase